jgi:hypothetical protein
MLRNLLRKNTDETHLVYRSGKNTWGKYIHVHPFCNDFYILSTKPKVWLDHSWDLRIFQMDSSGQALKTGWRMLKFLGENQNVNLGRNVNP